MCVKAGVRSQDLTPGFRRPWRVFADLSWVQERSVRMRAHIVTPASSFAALLAPGMLLLLNACPSRSADPAGSAAATTLPAVAASSPAPSPAEASPTPTPVPSAPTGAAAPAESPTPTPTAVPEETRPNDPPKAETIEPALVGSDGKPLPQTEDVPRTDSPAFLERMRRLVAAIRTDDPEVARSAFFPVVAYEQVKAIAHPARDWERRLFAAFARNVHEYHRSFGKSAGTLELVGVDVPEASSRWMKPGSEGNRIGYHRVLRSRLRVKDASGRERALEITSMISWRGEWYVVHLHGFE